MDKQQGKRHMRKDLLSRREALHRIGGFSFAAATILTGAGILLPGCGGGGGGGGDNWVNDTPINDGSSMQTAKDIGLGDTESFSLNEGSQSEMWFKVTLSASVSAHSIARPNADSGVSEIIIDVYSSDPDESTALRVYRQEGSTYDDDESDPCMQGDRLDMYIDSSSEDHFHIQFELLSGYTDAQVEFTLWDAADPSWDNAWNDWSDNPWNDWSDNPWNDWSDHWYDWWNMPWGNWMQSW